MSMVFCRGCGKEIHETAPTCPHCGAKQRVEGERSKTTAALLALFLGWIGFHKFYLGRTGLGILYLLFFWTLIPAVIGFIEAIALFSMSDQKFNLAYNDEHAAVDGPTPDTHVKCPDCRELVIKDAAKCRHCGAKLIPQK